MKFHWGHGIFIFMTFFVGFMGYLTYRTFSKDVDLVAEDYYAQEIVYQDRIDEMTNAARLAHHPTVQVESHHVRISFPESELTLTSGEVYFYDPRTTKGDRTYPLELDEDASMKVPLSLLDAMNYQVKMSWENNGKRYFHETNLRINQ